MIYPNLKNTFHIPLYALYLKNYHRRRINMYWKKLQFQSGLLETTTLEVYPYLGEELSQQQEQGHSQLLLKQVQWRILLNNIYYLMT